MVTITFLITTLKFNRYLKLACISFFILLYYTITFLKHLDKVSISVYNMFMLVFLQERN